MTNTCLQAWDVVLFKKEKKVEYVPSSWRVNGRTDLYLWPNLSLGKVRKLLKQCHPPDINIQYQEYEGICKATVDSLEKAEELVKKLQFSSDLSSEVSSEKPSSEEESDEDIAYDKNNSKRSLFSFTRKINYIHIFRFKYRIITKNSQVHCNYPI